MIGAATEESKPRAIALIVAPSGQIGGGMGRVKDYMLMFNRADNIAWEFRELITRDNRGNLRGFINTLTGIWFILRLQKSRRLALVHVNLGDNASALRKGFIIVLARFFGAKVLLHLHAVVLRQQWIDGGRLRRWIIGIPFRSASTNVVLGQGWKQWLVEDLGVPENRVDVVPNGVPVPEYTKRNHAERKDEIRLLFVGNLLQRKGVDDLVTAAKAIETPGIRWSLTFLGGGDVAEYRNAARAAGLSDRLHFAGWADAASVANALANADAMVLPSYQEGLPLVILESLGAGTPVICTPVGAISEFLRDGETAIFVKPGDVGALAYAIRSVIMSPALRQAMGDAGRLEYEARFSLLSFRKSLFRVYRERLGLVPELTP